MGASLAGLLILSVMLTGAFMFWRVDLLGNDLMGAAQKQMIRLEGAKARTEFDITSTLADTGTAILALSVLNNGATSVAKSNFPTMDIIVHYTGGAKASMAFTYTASYPPAVGEWNDTLISGRFDADIWDPEETLSIEVALGTPCVAGTVTIGTPNGVIDTKIGRAHV